MSCARYVFAGLAVLPLAGQAWDVRVEVPFLEGQRLPGTFVQGAGRLVDDGLDQGGGAIVTLSHRLVRVNPVLRLDWSVEFSRLSAEGDFRVGSSAYTSRLVQQGFGVGLDAQFWLPFTGVAGEFGLVQRFQDYRFRAAGRLQKETLSRTWLRAGVRWRLSLPVAAPYLTASYQQPLSRARPVSMADASDLASCLAAQGKGQEFERLWTFGVGVQF